MSIDPTTGGHTVVQGGHPPTILCGGYIGSSILGGLFILGGFDTLVAKILSFVAGVGLIAPLSLVRDKLYVPFQCPPASPSALTRRFDARTGQSCSLCVSKGC